MFSQDAYSIPLRRAALGNLYVQTYQKLGNVKEPYSHVYYHPKNLQQSEIIQEDEVKYFIKIIYIHFPIISH